MSLCLTATPISPQSIPFSDKKRTFKTFRNYVVEQQAILIALLNQFGEVTITRPTKKSVLTEQRIRVDTITIKNEIFDVSSFVEKRCGERLTLDLANKIPRKTAVRRQTANKIMEAHHLLCDLLFEHGYVFETSFTSGKNNTPKMELVHKIIENGLPIFDKLSIAQAGSTINGILCKRLSENRVISIPKNDVEITPFIKKTSSSTSPFLVEFDF